MSWEENRVLSKLAITDWIINNEVWWLKKHKFSTLVVLLLRSPHVIRVYIGELFFKSKFLPPKRLLAILKCQLNVIVMSNNCYNQAGRKIQKKGMALSKALSGSYLCH